ncbi:FxsA family protein [Pseudocolwellia agarivorans]|uniref:FxsA family protein n=1 Tax=Pseudocolwellia agarivorans TaxID=1911682 RepID=UPI000986C2F0|nr:FxsA family protein [Pseudocolwellia agarivorans]
MFRFLFLLFIVIPIIEIALLMKIGGWIGVWPTITIVIVTAWLGAKNVRQQGLATLSSLQTKMAQGQAPSEEIVSGLMLLIAGILLVTPGFVTDIFGLSLLIPAFRKSIAKAFQKVMPVQTYASGGFQQQNHYHHEQAVNDDFSPESESSSKPSIHQGKILDGEFERKE